MEHTYVQVDQRPSPIHGIGLFAGQTIPPYTYILMGFTEYDNDNCYVYENARYINHSICPNTMIIEKNRNYYVVSIYKIQKGEEILSNYYETPPCIMKPYHFTNEEKNLM